MTRLSNPLVICSLKYAPGLRKEFLLLGQGFARHGIDVAYGLGALYAADFSEEERSDTHCHSVNSGRGGWRFLVDAALFPLIFWRLVRITRGAQGVPTYLFYNPHPMQPLIQLMLRLFLQARIVTVLHEPNKRTADLKKYGLKGFLYFVLAMFIQSLSVRASNTIVTMSPYGADLFAEKYPKRAADLIAAHLLLTPHSGAQTLVAGTDRQFFSFVGTVNRGKNIDDIIAAVNGMIAGELDPVPFLVITPSNIEAELAQLSPGFREHLRIINKPRISDAEIAEAVSHSRAVLILHKTASQSGVLPMSYSHSTPVIARDLVAFTQYIQDSGTVLPLEFEPDDLVKACRKVIESQEKFCEGAARQFETKFAESNFDRLYQPLIEAIQPSSVATIK